MNVGDVVGITGALGAEVRLQHGPREWGVAAERSSATIMREYRRGILSG